MAEKDIRKLAAVMFTDIQGYSASVQDDEKAGLIKVEAHRQHLRHYTEMYHGQVIQYYGDGSLSIYDSVVDAVHCAIAMQKAYLTVDPVPVRIGIHVGDIVVKDHSVFGDGVNIAARIQAVGIPGSVLVSQRVQSEVGNHKDIQTKFIGLQRLKNIKEPVGIYAITNEGLKVPPASNRIRQLAKTNRIVPLIVLLSLVVWFLLYKSKGLNIQNQLFTAESISIPILKNFTGDPTKDLIGEMASHWMTKELSRIPDANVVSSESASQMIQLAGMDLTSSRGMRNYASLTGAVNIVDANYTLIGSKLDTLLMSGYIRNLTTGLTLIDLPDITCLATSPLDCIREMSSKIKGYWVSKDDHVLSPPDYESYKAYLAARGSWRTPEKEFVVEQLNKSIALDSGFIDPYFLLLDFLYNEGEHAAAADTIRAMRKKFTNLDARQTNLLDYHHADVSGNNKEAYHYFLNEYKLDPRDLFTNNSAMVLALMYMQDPVQAINFFEEIPVDSLHMYECTYCAERLDLAMWAALDAGNTKLADQLAPKMEKILSTRQGYGMLIMYYVSKNNVTKIDELIAMASRDSTLDGDWHYLDFLAGRLFLLQENQTSASKYAKRAIASYGVVPKKNFRMLGRSYYMDQQFDKALEYYQLAHEEWPSYNLILSELGMVYARMNDKVKTTETINQLDSLRTPWEYGSTEYFQGRLYAITGDLPKATEYLSKALDKGQKFEMWASFKHDPDLKALKNYEPYKKLIASLKE